MAGRRANRSWRLLWTGATASTLGDYVFDTTMVLWIGIVVARGQSWAPAAVSGVLIAASIPAIFLGPVAGVFADRWNHRRTMLVADACRAVLMLALLPLAWPSVEGHVGRAGTLALAYLIVAAASCFSQFFNPARFAMIAEVVDPADMPRASGLLMATVSLAGVIGPPIAAPLLFVSGVQWALLINAASFAVSFGTIWLLRAPAVDTVEVADGETPADFFGEFRAGLRFFATNRVLLAMAIGAVIATLGTGGINALNVFFITHNLHVPVKWYGTMGTADGLGSVLGALAAGVIAAKIAPRRLFWVALVAAGVLIIAYSRMTALLPALILLALIGIVVGSLNVAISPLLLSVTPQEMIGRVVSVMGPLQQIAALASTAVAGFLVSTALRGLHQSFAGTTFGPYDTVFAIGGLLFIIGGLAAIPLLATAPAGQAEDPTVATVTPESRIADATADLAHDFR
jgi:MFS family permease